MISVIFPDFDRLVFVSGGVHRGVLTGECGSELRETPLSASASHHVVYEVFDFFSLRSSLVLSYGLTEKLGRG